MDARLAAFLGAEMHSRVKAADASIARVLRLRTARLALAADYADYKSNRPLSGEQARNIEDVLPGVQHIPFEKVPFWDALNTMQSTHAGMDPQTYADTREGWWEHNVPSQHVSLDPKRLVVTQKTVNEPRVKQLMEHPETGGNKPLYVVRHGGKDYTINGHHRIVADLLKGNLDHDVRLLDLDKAGQAAAAYNPRDDPRMKPGGHPVGDLNAAYADMLSRLHPDDAALVQQHLHAASLHTVAHDSGDGETIYHCPFCGSGQVIGGSDGTSTCDFCGTVFTVQVQPEFSAMPQTVDGTSYPMPGMPGAPTDTPAGADSEDDVDAAQEDAVQQGGAPQPQGGPPPAPGQQPFPQQMQTATGARVDFEEALAHYALRHAGDDRPIILQRVRAMHTEEN